MPVSVNKPKTDWEFNSLLADAANDVLVVINFHTPWAEPCKQMNQVFEAIASKLADGTKAVFISVDAEELPDVSESYEVEAVPLVVVFRGGKKEGSVSGADAKGLDGLVGRLLGGGGVGGDVRKGGLGGLPSVQRVVDEKSAVEEKGEKGEKGEEEEEEEEEEEGEKEDLNVRLGKLVKAAPVMLFMKGTPAAPQCGFSRQMVGLLRERGVRYGFFNILADDEVRQGLKVFSDWPTYPQLYVEGELVGGLDIVKEEMENDSEFLKNMGAPKAPEAMTGVTTVA